MYSRRAILLSIPLVLAGCSSWDPWKFRSQSPEEPVTAEQMCTLVGDLAVPYELYPIAIEGIGLVTGLKGTGSDPKPSVERTILMAEMQKRGIKNANAVLASADTALVLVRGYLRPGIQEGDRLDVEIRVPSQSETTSLRGGWLLETHLQEMAVMDDNRIHSGRTLAIAQGPILVDPAADPKNKNDRVRLCRGRILGGAVSRKSRPLSLVLKPQHKSVFNAAKIEQAINKRFTIVQKGIKSGVAKAETDQIVKLTVHPRYKDNVERYVHVVRSVALRENETERMERLGVLDRQLLDPIGSERAALQLEAIGRHGADTLRHGIKSPDPEVSFFSAEALAYLDESDAAAPLAQAARQQPAFRVFALAALSAMNDYAAYEQLKELLGAPSVETRYGAFRALWTMNHNDPLVLGEKLGDFSYHVLDTSGPPLIHVTRSRRAEVVLFGADHRLRPPVAIEAGNHILVTSSRPGEVTVSKFVINEPDQKRVVSDRVDDVLRAIVELGGTYPDVVQALQQAKASGTLLSRFEIDAIPEAGRTYRRQTARDVQPADEKKGGGKKGTDAYARSEDDESTQSGGSSRRSAGSGADEADSEKGSHPVRAFFAKITGRESKD